MRSFYRFSRWLTRTVNTLVRPQPLVRVGDLVRFEPDERTIGWTQDFGGLSVGYTGKVTRVEKNYENFWIVYVDDLPEGFADYCFQPVRESDHGDTRPSADGLDTR